MGDSGSWSANVTKRVLIVAAAGEAITGLALLLVPSLVGQLLLGEGLTGVAIVVARVAGFGLVGLAISCSSLSPLIGMLAYSTGVALYLAYLGLAANFSGLLLWPAVALHVALSFGLGCAWLATKTR